MCGIVGIIAKTEKGKNAFPNMEDALHRLSKRGPDYQQFVIHHRVALGHARLSIIDPTPEAHQPFTDESGRYTLLYNGEFYNYREERKRLRENGVSFTTESDTEVLLKLFIHEGESCLKRINGFFAFAVYDREKKKVFLARDRMGIKPLVFYEDDDKLIFASELKAISAFHIEKEINHTAVFNYFQLNYIPQPHTIYTCAKKVAPGHSMRISWDSNEQFSPVSHTSIQWYTIPFVKENIKQVTPENYESSKVSLRKLLTAAIEKRLVADVPLGSFLSGGVDSSLISIIANQLQPGIQTFSIGYPNDPFFDETEFAQAVAKKHNIKHEVFNLTQQDLRDSLWNAVDHFDEPFGDSSALPVYILSKLTKQKVKVALSGDGADELFAGYNKHWAEFKALNPGVEGILARALGPVAAALPQSRNGKFSNLNRKLLRFREGLKLPRKERYWRWATICNEEDANYLIKEKLVIKEQRLTDEAYTHKKLKELYTKGITKEGTINEVLHADCQLVLPNDMLFKVDSMSMANGLEVRTPFLDHELVEFAFTLPSAFKINSNLRKKILQETFREELPELLFNRPKKGFEVPLLDWFKTELKSTIENDLLAEDFIEDQGIFNPEAVKKLKQTLFSSNPKDSVATTWDFIVFQRWYKNYIEA